MAKIIAEGALQFLGLFITGVVILPAAILFAAYLIYSIVMSIKELKKK